MAALEEVVLCDCQYICARLLFCVADQTQTQPTTSPPALSRSDVNFHADCSIASKGGHDAFFACDTETHAVLGIADGVGGWTE